MTSGRETATARLVKPACAVRDEDSRYGVVKGCIKVQEKKKKVVVLGYRPPKNAKLCIFRRGRAITAKKCTKKRDARFANLNQLLFAFLVDVALVVAQAVLDTVRRASWGKNRKRLICI